MGSAGPSVIEAAINGSTTKEANPNVPRAIDEIVATALACVEAGASIVHNHNDEPNFGEPSTHSPDPYESAWHRIWDTHPGLLMHPTTSGERTAGIDQRFSHIQELHRRGSLTMSTADAGCFSLALDAPGGPVALPVFGNATADVDWIFGWCREADVPVHVSIFEPGHLRLVLAHRRAGSVPRRTKVQLYFGGRPCSGCRRRSRAWTPTPQCSPTAGSRGWSGSSGVTCSALASLRLRFGRAATFVSGSRTTRAPSNPPTNSSWPERSTSL